MICGIFKSCDRNVYKFLLISTTQLIYFDHASSSNLCTIVRSLKKLTNKRIFAAILFLKLFIEIKAIKKSTSDLPLNIFLEWISVIYWWQWKNSPESWNNIWRHAYIKYRFVRDWRQLLRLFIYFPSILSEVFGIKNASCTGEFVMEVQISAFHNGQ